jgi:hypothetical protein
MSRVKRGQLAEMTQYFVPPNLRVQKDDDHFFRNLQNNSRVYRSLTSEEIEILVKNNNTAESWDTFFVTQHFNPNLVRNCDFWGMVRIGDMTPGYLKYNELCLPVGLNNCSIMACDIGDNVVLRNVHHLAHYIIGNEVILFNIQEMLTVNHAKFGNGIVKKGESENVRIWLEVANENGGRKILPFTGILPADAYIWSSFRDETDLMRRFQQMTDDQGDVRRGYYGIVGNYSVVKNCRIIKDVYIGENAYIKGANKLKNLTIQSSLEEPTQIGEGVEMVNGIIGYNNRIFYGVKAVRFVTGRNVQLKYGARLINSFLGPNSTVSCCEILNNLVFNFHEQHHNNSFLIASTVMGQSNIAAGATIGSNHNSRAADGEIIANRGFWPGLETNFKHNSRFASFVLISKGTFEREMNIIFPFSLVSMGDDPSIIQILPAYWFRYNMYALARNAWKFQKRDKRKIKEQHIEMDYLAPDTVEEMLGAMERLENELIQKEGFDHDHLKTDMPIADDLTLTLEGLVKKGWAKIKRPVQGYRLYRKMITYYGQRELKRAMDKIRTRAPHENPIEYLYKNFDHVDRKWMNIGGQLIPEQKVYEMIEKVKQRNIDSWQEMHRAYDQLWQQYPDQRMRHGVHTLLKITNRTCSDIDHSWISDQLQEMVRTDELLLKWTIQSRQKDFDCDFRQMTCRNEKELIAVMGNLQENPFIQEYQEQHNNLVGQINELIDWLDEMKKKSDS